LALGWQVVIGGWRHVDRAHLLLVSSIRPLNADFLRVIDASDTHRCRQQSSVGNLQFQHTPNSRWVHGDTGINGQGRSCGNERVGLVVGAQQNERERK
jgi:hypothetical protein